MVCHSPMRGGDRVRSAPNYGEGSLIHCVFYLFDRVIYPSFSGMAECVCQILLRKNPALWVNHPLFQRKSPGPGWMNCPWKLRFSTSHFPPWFIKIRLDHPRSGESGPVVCHIPWSDSWYQYDGTRSPRVIYYKSTRLAYTGSQDCCPGIIPDIYTDTGNFGTCCWIGDIPGYCAVLIWQYEGCMEGVILQNICEGIRGYCSLRQTINDYIINQVPGIWSNCVSLISATAPCRGRCETR